MYDSIILGSIIIALSIIASSIILGRYISSIKSDIGNYHAFLINSDTIMIIDTATGTCHTKKIEGTFVDKKV